MIKDTFCGNDYFIWHLDLSKFAKKDFLDKQLNSKFEEASKNPYPPEANGPAYSIDLFRLNGAKDLLHFISPSLDDIIRQLNLPIMKKVIRVWANRMHKGSSGNIHCHKRNDRKGKLFVLICYYNIPEDSGNLVLIDSKYEDKLSYMKTEDMIPDADKKKISVSEGMCVLHDEYMFHAVSKHDSHKTRDSIILEFIC